jgi:membrane protease YdiL (CAAX protease family)
MKTLNKTTLFLILTFVISFSSAGIYKLLGGTGSGTTIFTLLGAFYMFIPTICVLIVEKLVHKEKIKTRLMISFKINKWFFVAWLFMPVVIFSTLGLNLLFPDVTFNPDMTGMLDRVTSLLPPDQIEQAKQSIKNLPISYMWIVLFQGLIAGITVNGVAAFGEELGWRGFLLRQYQHFSFFKASLVIGFIWGIWHAPLILMGHNYPQHPQIGVLMMVVMCVLLTPFLLYISIKAKSVIAAAIMHGTMNAVAGISIMGINGGNDLTSGIAGLAGFIASFLFLVLLVIYDQFISKEKITTTPMSKHLQKSL